VGKGGGSCLVCSGDLGQEKEKEGEIPHIDLEKKRSQILRKRKEGPSRGGEGEEPRTLSPDKGEKKTSSNGGCRKTTHKEEKGRRNKKARRLPILPE